MSDLRRKTFPQYKSALTPDEATQMAAIHARSAEIDAERRQLTEKRSKIIRRGCLRALTLRRRMSPAREADHDKA